MKCRGIQIASSFLREGDLGNQLGEGIMAAVNETMTHLVVGLGLLLVVLGGWTLIQEILTGVLQ